MMLLHGNSLGRERRRLRPAICYNVVEGARIVTKAARQVLLSNFEPEEQPYVDIVEQAYSDNMMNFNACNLNDAEEVVDAIKFLYKKSKTFQKALQQRNQFSLFETWFYFAEKLNEYPAWGGRDWQPSEEDMLHSRNRTTGLMYFNFTLNDQKYQLTDLGGQRGERSKGFLYNLDIDCLLFVVSLSEYDEALFEDVQQNRLKESIATWKQVFRDDTFANIPIILYFNKLDLFKQKYYTDKVRIVPTFKYKIPPPKFEEEADAGCQLALQWFADLYRNQVPYSRLSQVDMFFMSAFDTESVQTVMNQTVDFLHNKLEVKTTLTRMFV